jgi:hypothetical protein
MRTTVTINDHLLDAAKRRAREHGQTLGQVIEAGLRRELSQTRDAQAVEIPVFHGHGGPLPGVDLNSNRALAELLDRDKPITKLR